MSKIAKVEATTIFDSRSIPTVEVEVKLDSGISERALVYLVALLKRTKQL